MRRNCPTCLHPNVEEARFCAHCGRRLPNARTGKECCGTSRWRWLLLGGFGLIWIAPSCPGPRALLSALQYRSLTHVAHRSKLSPRKAELLKAFLDENSAGLALQWDGSGVVISGPADSVNAVRRFAELLARLEHLPASHRDREIQRLAGTWHQRDVYTLSGSRTSHLFELLAFPDVPVYVGYDHHRLIVQGSPWDLGTIRDVVSLSGSKRCAPRGASRRSRQSCRVP